MTILLKLKDAKLELKELTNQHQMEIDLGETKTKIIIPVPGDNKFYLKENLKNGSF